MDKKEIFFPETVQFQVLGILFPCLSEARNYEISLGILMQMLTNS